MPKNKKRPNKLVLKWQGWKGRRVKKTIQWIVFSERAKRTTSRENFSSVRPTGSNPWGEIPKSNKKKTKQVGLRVAGVEGIEPSSKVLETPILPMNYTPMHINNYNELDFFVNVFMLKYLYI